MYYSNLDYYRTMFDTGRLPYDLWVGQYASEPSITGMAMWQYTSTGSVPGISGDCDKNYSYKDYGKPSPSPGPSVPDEYTVQPGDTLSEIALRFGTTVSKLAQLNGITDPNKIYPVDRCFVSQAILPRVRQHTLYNQEIPCLRSPPDSAPLIRRWRNSIGFPIRQDLSRPAAETSIRFSVRQSILYHPSGRYPFRYRRPLWHYRQQASESEQYFRSR